VQTNPPSEKIASETILRSFHHKLNSATLVPAKAYRRNSGLYPLVSYVNNLLGAMLSENYDVASVFVARAAEHMAAIPASEESRPYYSLVSRYLSHVIHHLSTFHAGVQFDTERIPKEILNAGPQAGA
jgi:hypothetical protein